MLGKKWPAFVPTPRELAKRMSRALCLAGAVVLAVGLYCWLVKAGLPPQDAPPDIQQEYAFNLRLGGLLTKAGAGILLWGLAARWLVGRLFR